MFLEAGCGPRTADRTGPPAAPVNRLEILQLERARMAVNEGCVDLARYWLLKIGHKYNF
jgi:hypothetical protein